MRRLLLPLAVCFATAVSAQKKIALKKNTIKQDDQVIAEFDGQGSMFKMVKLGVFAPGSKDTLIRITEDNFDAQNPLFPKPQVVYRIEFPNSTHTGFYINNPKRLGVRVMEKGTMELLFNDGVPVLINQGKIDEAAVQTYRSDFAYDFEGFKQKLKRMEDSIAIVVQTGITRDRTKPVTFKTVSNLGDAYYAEQVNEIYQDGVLLGKVEKQITGNAFPKTVYAFWKKVPPVTIGGIAMEYAPVAICSTGPNGGDIPFTTVVGKKQAMVKGTYNSLDAPIANALIQQQLL